MNIRDVRVGMMVVFNDNKINLTKGKQYEVIDVLDRNEGVAGVVSIRDDVGNIRILYARRFDPVAPDPAIPMIARPFAVGDVIKEERYNIHYTVFELNPDGYITINDRQGRYIGKYLENRFVLVRRAEQQPQAIIDNVAIKAGDFVKVVKKANAKRANWTDEMDKSLGTLFQVVEYSERIEAYLLKNGYYYARESLELHKGEVPVKKKKVVKKKFPALKALIAKSRKEDIKKVAGVSSYVVFVKDKKTGEITLNKNLADVCHARLSVYNANQGSEFVAVIDYQQAHEKQILKGYEKQYRKFVDYIVNHSPWRVAFQGKTVKNILENGVLMNVDAPSGAVAGACQALRYLSEFKNQIKVWDLMLKNGIGLDAAFLTTYAIIDEGNGKYTKSPMGGGHQPISGSIPAGALLSFFANGYDEAFLKTTPYRERSAYRVHEHVTNTTDVLRLGGGYYSTYVSNNVKFKIEEGEWDQIHIATQEQVIAFAKHLEEQLNKAREAKAAQ